jgi:hypothetical protein
MASCTREGAPVRRCSRQKKATATRGPWQCSTMMCECLTSDYGSARCVICYSVGYKYLFGPSRPPAGLVTRASSSTATNEPPMQVFQPHSAGRAPVLRRPPPPSTDPEGAPPTLPYRPMQRFANLSGAAVSDTQPPRIIGAHQLTYAPRANVDHQNQHLLFVVPIHHFVNITDTRSLDSLLVGLEQRQRRFQFTTSMGARVVSRKDFHAVARDVLAGDQSHISTTESLEVFLLGNPSSTDNTREWLTNGTGASTQERASAFLFDLARFMTLHYTTEWRNSVDSLLALSPGIPTGVLVVRSILETFVLNQDVTTVLERWNHFMTTRVLTRQLAGEATGPPGDQSSGDDLEASAEDSPSEGETTIELTSTAATADRTSFSRIATASAPRFLYKLSAWGSILQFVCATLRGVKLILKHALITMDSSSTARRDMLDLLRNAPFGVQLIALIRRLRTLQAESGEVDVPGLVTFDPVLHAQVLTYTAPDGLTQIRIDREFYATLLQNTRAHVQTAATRCLLEWFGGSPDAPEDDIHDSIRGLFDYPPRPSDFVVEMNRDTRRAEIRYTPFTNFLRQFNVRRVRSDLLRDIVDSGLAPLAVAFFNASQSSTIRLQYFWGDWGDKDVTHIHQSGIGLYALTSKKPRAKNRHVAVVLDAEVHRFFVLLRMLSGRCLGQLLVRHQFVGQVDAILGFLRPGLGLTVSVSRKLAGQFVNLESGHNETRRQQREAFSANAAAQDHSESVASGIYYRGVNRAQEVAWMRYQAWRASQGLNTGQTDRFNSTDSPTWRQDYFALVLPQLRVYVEDIRADLAIRGDVEAILNPGNVTTVVGYHTGA